MRGRQPGGSSVGNNGRKLIEDQVLVAANAAALVRAEKRGNMLRGDAVAPP